MINGNLKFFPKYMDMCKNNPKEAKKIIKFFKSLNYLYVCALIVVFIYETISYGYSVNDLTLSHIGPVFLIFVFAMLPLLFFLSIINELTEGIRYFKEKEQDI